MQARQKASENSLSKNFTGLGVTSHMLTIASSARVLKRQLKWQNGESLSSGQCLERDRNQHEIQMTDDPHYRDWYRKQQKQKEIDEYGIDE